MESKVKDQTAEIEKLKGELDELLGNADLTNLTTENRKLNYQINILQRSIQEEKANLKPITGQHFW